MGYILLSILLSIILFYYVHTTGKELYAMKSMMLELENYEADKKNQSFVQSWVLGWTFKTTRIYAKWLNKRLGDYHNTLLLKFTGALFLLMSYLIIAGIIAQFFMIIDFIFYS